MPATYTVAPISREQISFEPSAVFDLVLAIGTVNWRPFRHRAWVDRARALLGPELLSEVQFFTGSECSWLSLSEFPVDYKGDPFDINSFIAYIEAMSLDDFFFYLWGRIIPREDVAQERRDPANALQRLAQFYSTMSLEKPEAMLSTERVFIEALSNAEATKARAVHLLREFHKRVFSAELSWIGPVLLTSAHEQHSLLDRMDSESYLNRLMGVRPMPVMFPEGTTISEIHIIPSLFTWKTNMEIWGYGSVFLIYDAGLNETRRSELDQDITQLGKIASALSDATRLRILRSVVQESEVYGHRLAKLHGISQPAVSRHMGILKDAGLIGEEPRDGRILYHLKREPIAGLSQSLLHFLED